MEEILKVKTQEDTKKAMAKVMKKNGEPIEKIVEYTGLSEAVVRGMRG